MSNGTPTQTASEHPILHCWEAGPDDMEEAILDDDQEASEMSSATPKQTAARMEAVDRLTIRLFATIRLLADGNSRLRDRAIEIHRRYIPTLGVRGTPEQRFMAEVDNPCPDLALRARYREELLSSPSIS